METVELKFLYGLHIYTERRTEKIKKESNMPIVNNNNHFVDRKYTSEYVARSFLIHAIE